MTQTAAPAAYSCIDKKWPNHISLDLLRSTLCKASDDDVFQRVKELQKRFTTLNCSVRNAKHERNELRQQCTETQQAIEFYEEKVKNLTDNMRASQYTMDENNEIASRYYCEVQLLQNQPPPKLPPKVTEELQISGDLEKLSDNIFETYAALLVLRSGEVILFEDMKKQIEKRPAGTRQLKQCVKDFRKRIRQYEQSIFGLTGDQKRWKGTLKAGKTNICRRARHQHNGLKEEAARLKRTIDLFNEEKNKLMQAAKSFEAALTTTIGETELAELMEHFEVFSDSVDSYAATSGTGTVVQSTTGNLRSMFKNHKTSMAMASNSKMHRLSTISSTSLEMANKISQLQKTWLDSVGTKVKMEANLLRTEFDIGLLEASLTAESYYTSKKSEEERKREIRALVSGTTSDDLLEINEGNIAEYFDPEVKFPGRSPHVQLATAKSKKACASGK